MTELFDGWAFSLGFRIDGLEPNLDQWKKLIHPEDLSRMIDSVGDYLSGKTKLLLLHEPFANEIR
tara:strand:+ start:772 stop:966 length:195 start_codon:yes stop_codon:yes gene_type:complete